mgnify:CR=1 FL=1
MIVLNEKLWEYDKKWFKKNLKPNKKNNLDSICKISGAHSAVENYLINIGELAFKEALSLNSILECNSISKLDNLDIIKLKDICESLDCFTTRTKKWEGLYYEFSKMKIFNCKYSPEPILSALCELDNIIVSGYFTWRQLRNDALYKYKKEMKVVNEERERLNLMRFNQMEMAGVKVNLGYIYIFKLTNKENEFKIGFSGRDPELRRVETSKDYGVDLKLIKYWKTKDPYIFEQRIHSNLLQFRSKREIFCGNINYFIEVIEKTLQR